MENKAELHRLFRDRISTNTTAHWLGRLEQQDLLSAPVQTLGEALASEQTAVNGMVVTIDGDGSSDPSGRNEPLRLVGSPITMDPSAFRLRHAPPSLGVDGGDILAELGYPPERIAELRAAKVFS
jgi:formyl-CoA transferase